MKQVALPFQYAGEKSTTGMTALSGLPTYLELIQVCGLKSSIERCVGLRRGGQGWTDSQIVTSLILLNPVSSTGQALAGGESVSDLDVLEKDEGFCRVLRETETVGMSRRERVALGERWRVERRRTVPSESAVFRYLSGFNDADEESRRQAHRAFIPTPNQALRGLWEVNAEMVGFVQSRSPHTVATLDMDATLVETHKQEALFSYRKYRAYQPQASESGPLQPDRPCWPGHTARSKADHTPGAWTPLIRVGAQSAAEAIGAGCRAVTA